MKTDTWEKVVIVFICLLSVAITYAVYDTLMFEPVPTSVHTRTDIGPPIAQCDEELWERIRNGCN